MLETEDKHVEKVAQDEAVDSEKLADDKPVESEVVPEDKPVETEVVPEDKPVENSGTYWSLFRVRLELAVLRLCSLTFY